MSEPVTQEFLDQRLAAFAQQLTVELAKRFGEIDRRFGEIDKRFGQIDLRFGEIDRRFDEIDRRLAEQDVHWEQRLRDEIDGLREEMDAGFTGIHERLDHWIPRKKPEPARVHLLLDE